MYCANCGTNNQDGVKYCVSCGKPMEVRPVYAVPTGTDPRKILSFACFGPIIIFICMFLPWLTISASLFGYGGNLASISGWRSGAWAVFVFIFSLVALVSVNKQRSGAQATLAAGIACIICLIIVAATQSGSFDYYGLSSGGISMGIGYFGAWIVSVAFVAIGGWALSKLHQ